MGKGFLVLALLALAPAPAQDAPLESHAVRSLYVGQPEGTHTELFRLDLEDGDGQNPIGLARWITGPDPDAERGWRVELDVHFFDAETRVFHSERLRPGERKLVWREVREQAGRTVLFVWDPASGASSFEMMGGDLHRKEHEVGRGAFLPLALIERIRRGAAPREAARVYQPLANGIEALSLAVREEGNERVVELQRPGGQLAGSYRFAEGRLEGFRWQEGGPVATRISRAQFEALHAGRIQSTASDEESQD